MRVFVLGVGATGSYLVKLLLRQGHHVTCGDRDPERARRFLGATIPVAVERVNGRNRWSIIKASRGAQLIVNMLPSVYNRTVLRAVLYMRAHYLDTAAHLTKSPFRAEQLQFTRRFIEKRRTAVITAGVAPGLTNLLAAAAADSLDAVETVRVRLYESTESEHPVSQWSADVSFDEAVSPPCVYRDGRYALARRFGERELFRFPPPIGWVPVMLAAQDEVATIPHVIALRSMDVKIGGPDVDRLRRWYRQGKLRKSQGPVAVRFPRTPTPDAAERLIEARILRNARFAATVVVEGMKSGRQRTIRWDVAVPTLRQLHRKTGLWSPIAWATAQMASLFIKHLPRDCFGVHAPEALPREVRRAILRDARVRGFRLVKRETSRNFSRT
jgi:hypothetical protein